MGGGYMLREGPPNIWQETHSSLTVSNSIPAQQVREKRKGEERRGGIKEEEEEEDEKKQKEQSIYQSGLRMTRDHCLCESSQCYLRPHHSVRLYSRAEQSTLMWSKQLHAHSSTFNPLFFPLSFTAVPDYDAGCGYVNPESP